ncbi:MAG: hypothetical protein JSW58_05000 [Candidatus Latescibacterota bacterium]|nr:MAG: hypothetical protein JSW58_05000 [Candidatus Latescibacterota bacterium]
MANDKTKSDLCAVKPSTDEFEQRGGARTDSFNATWPFARLTATREAIDLYVAGKRYHFPREDIEALRPYRGLVSRGLQIEHRVSSPLMPTLVVFWPLKFVRLRAGLGSLGYAVLGRDHERKWWQHAFRTREPRHGGKPPV